MKSEVNSCVSSQSAGKESLGDALEEFNKSEKQRKGKDSKQKMGKISNEDLEILKNAINKLIRLLMTLYLTKWLAV